MDWLPLGYGIVSAEVSKPLGIPITPPSEYWLGWAERREQAQLGVREIFGTGISGVIGQRELTEYRTTVTEWGSDVGFKWGNLGLYLTVGLVGLILLGLAWRRS